MNRGLRIFFVCFILLFPIILNGQNSYIYKTVNLAVGQIKLKDALKIVSSQTGCVFSYDATKINGNQEIIISENYMLSLQKTLQKILPEDIHYNLMGKYVILHKFSEKRLTSSLLSPKPLSAIQSIESINPDRSLKLDTLLPFIYVTDTLKNHSLKSKDIFELEVAENNHLATISTHIGKNHIYSIFSMGYDYYGSYHLGVGAGLNLKIAKHIGANIDLTEYALVAGKSIKYDTRAYTTQLCPALYYSIGQRMKIVAGPSVYLINSKLVTGSSTSDLGKFIGYSATLGVRIDLKNTLKNKAKQ